MCQQMRSVDIVYSAKRLQNMSKYVTLSLIAPYGVHYELQGI